MLPTYHGLGKLLVAGVAGLSAGAVALIEVVTRADGFEWKIITALLGLVGVLLLAAWNDLKKRDEQASEARRDLYHRVNALDRELARLQGSRTRAKGDAR